MMTDSLHRLNSSSSDVNFKLSCDSVLSILTPPEQSFIDSILAYNDPQQAEIVLPNGQHFCWYFAIGSMINPISLYLRNVTSIMSYPATCLDHRITFRGHAGIASFESSPGETFDGVVHLVSNEQMTRLDEIECFYHRIKVTCVDYQGQSHITYAYQIKINNQPISLPRERYLDIIIKGCEYYKVRREYINRLRDQQAVIPRIQPENFQAFDNFPLDNYYSKEELQKHNGNDPSIPLWICINGKILEYAGLPSIDHPDYDFQRSFYTFLKPNLGAREVTTVMAKTLYEPLYKLPLHDDDICDEHRARIEDHYYTTLSNSHNKMYWKPIGRLRPSDDLSK